MGRYVNGLCIERTIADLDVHDARMALNDALIQLSGFDSVYPQFNIKRDVIDEITSNYDFKFEYDAHVPPVDEE